MDCETCVAFPSPLIKAAPSPEQVRDSIVGVRNLFRLIPIVCQGYAFLRTSLELHSSASAVHNLSLRSGVPAAETERGCPF